MNQTAEHRQGMLVLYGYAVSNYFNIARAALLETGVPHSVVDCRASRDESFLSRSPMGKIPFLETPDGYLAETIAMVEYINAVSSGTRLYPADAFQRARTTQLVNVAQTYIEAPARVLYPAVFMGGAVDAEKVGASRAVIERGVGAILKTGQFTPYLLGEMLTASDLFLFFCMDMADRTMRFTCSWSPIMSKPALTEWYTAMTKRPSIQTAVVEFNRALSVYLTEKNGAYDPATVDTTYALLAGA